MKKRVLSFVLALVMLVLAVPVFALPTLATDASPNPTVNFVIGQDAYDRTYEAIAGSTNVNATYENYGTVVKTVPWSSVSLPTDSELSSAGVTNAEILTWAFWDDNAKKFRDIDDYIKGFMKIPNVATLDLYPIYKSSSLMGQGNMPSWTVERTDVASNSMGYVASASRPAGAVPDSAAFAAFRGGYSLVEWTPSTNTVVGYYKTFDVQYWAISQQYLWNAGGIYNRDMQWIAIGNGKAAYSAVDYQVMRDAAMTVTVPMDTRIIYLVLLNGTPVESGASISDLSTWGSFAEGDGNATITFEAEKGDIIRIVVCSASASSVTMNKGATPTVTYDTLHTGGTVFTSVFSENKPLNNPSTTVNGDSEDVDYPSSWQYVSYGSKADALAGANAELLLTHADTGESWLVSAGGAGSPNGTKHAYVYWNSNKHPDAASYWCGAGMGFVGAGRVVGTRYTAPQSGYVDLSFETLGNWQKANSGVTPSVTTGFAILVGGVQVWPVDGAGEPTDNWYNVTFGSGDGQTPYATNIAATANITAPKHVFVEQGQTVEFLALAVDGVSGGWSSRANYAEGVITYTELCDAPEKPEVILYTSALSANKPTNDPRELNGKREQIFDEDGNPVLNENGNPTYHPATEPIVYPGAWQYITYPSLANAMAGINMKPLTKHYNNGESWLIAEDSTNPPYDRSGYVYWNASQHGATGSYWNGGGMGTPAAGLVVGSRYTAEYTGYIKVSFETLGNWQASGTVTTSYAILVDGVQVWPTDGSAWYTQTYGTGDGQVAFATNHAEAANATMPKKIFVTAGSTVEFLACGGDNITTTHQSRSNYAEGVVSYVEISDPPAVLVAPSIGDTLDLVFALGSANKNAGILIDGKEATHLTVAPQDADREFTVQAYLTIEGSDTVYGEEKRVTFNSILEKYLRDPAYGAKATAALAYTRAFSAYFANGTVAAPAAPVGDYTAKAADSYLKAAGYSGADKIAFRGVSLLLNEKVNIKIVVNTVDAKYALEVADNAAFTGATLIARETTEDGKSTKFIMDGISALNWNTDYYFRIVDTTSGNRVVSDTLRYGVSVYCARMNADASADQNIKNLASTMLCLFENLHTQEDPVTGLGDRIPTASPVLSRTEYGQLADTGYVVGITVSADYDGAVIRSDAGFRISGTDITISNVTLVGPVSFVGAKNVKLQNVQIIAHGKTAVAVDSASSDILFEDCRIEGATAVLTAGNNTGFLRSYIEYATSGVASTAASGLYLADCRLIGSTGTAITSDADSTEIRQCTVSTDKSSTAIAIGEARDVLIAASIIRGAGDTIVLTGTDNASVTLNDTIGVTAQNGKHIYVIDNEIAGALRLYDNNYLIADGNNFPSGDPHANVDKIGNTNTNGSNATDENARLSAGANEALLPHVDRDQFLGTTRLDTVKDPDAETEFTISEYIVKNAEKSPYVIVMPGAYASYSAIVLGEQQKDTVIYAYGVYAERVAEGATDNGGAPVYHSILNQRADNVTTKGITLGYEYQAVGQGRVVEIDKENGRIRIVTDAGFLGELGASDTSLYYSGTFFAYHAGDMYPYVDVQYTEFVSREADGSLWFYIDISKYWLRGPFEMIRVGDVMSARIANQNYATVRTENASGVIYKDLTEYSHSGGVGFAEEATYAVTYHRVINTSAAAKPITKAEYDKYQALETQYGISFDVYIDANGNYRGAPARTGSIDGIHAINTRKGSQLISTVMENMADDGTNQHGGYSRLSHIVNNGDGTATVVFKGNLTGVAAAQVNDPNAAITPNGWGRFPETGDKVLLYSLGSGEMICDATALTNTVSDGTRTTFWNTEVRCYKFTVSADAVNWTAYQTFVDRGVMDSPNDRISVLDTHVEDYKIAVENGSYACPGARFDNCLVQNTRSRGFLIKSSDVKITNCTFRNMAAAISVRNEGEWGETSFSRNVEIRNNLMEYTGHRGEAPKNSVISICGVGAESNVALNLDDLRTGNILIEGNVMKNRAAEYAISIMGASQVVIRGNDFGREVTMSGLVRQIKTLQLDQCKDITVENNIYPDPSVSVESTFSFTNVEGIVGSDMGDEESPATDWDPIPENLKTAQKYPYVNAATNTLYMTYGSSYTFENRVAIKENTEVVTSKKTGTATADDALFSFSADGKTITATATGAATVTFLGSEMNVVVVAAPMNLLFVTGQSNAAAEPGSDGADPSTFYDGFIRSEAGKAYYSHVSASVSIAEDSTNTPAMYLPNNLVWNSCYTNTRGWDPRVLSQEKGAATFGPGWSGLARVWTEETGEAVWIVNSSFGGMPIATFQPSANGEVVDNNYYRSVNAFNTALETLYREVDAGHFTLNHMAYYWCQGESDSRTRTEAEYYADFVNMHNGYMRDVVYNHNGVTKTLEYCGIAAIRSCYDSAGNSTSELHLTGPRLAQYYAAGMASGELSNVYLVSNATERWVGSDQNVVDYFTETYGSAENFKAYFGYDMPTTRASLHPVIHYSIQGYNEISMDVGRNSLRIINLTNPENGYDISLPMHTTKPSVTLLSANGYDAYTDTLWLDADTDSAIVYPALAPIYRTVEGLTLSTSTPGFRFEHYVLYRDDPTASTVTITVKLGGKLLETYTLAVKSMGSFAYNFPNIVNHGSSGSPDYEYLGNRGSWTPGVYNTQTGAFSSTMKLETGYAWLIPSTQTVWYSGVGGFGGDSGYVYGTAAGNAQATSFLALAYTAETTGSVGIGFSTLAHPRGTGIVSAYVGGSLVFEMTLDGTVDLDALNAAAESIRFTVNAGDQIYFTVRTPASQASSSQTLLHPVVYYHG